MSRIAILLESALFLVSLKFAYRKHLLLTRGMSA